jgi:hypothetical protein
MSTVNDIYKNFLDEGGILGNMPNEFPNGTLGLGLKD